MNKNELKNFAVYARKKLIEDIMLKASLVGVTVNGINKPLDETYDMVTFDIGLSEPYKIEGEKVKQRKQLKNELEKRTQVSDYTTAFNGLIEEVAYTWFNRIIALRFMEVNDYMPDHIRVLSSGKKNDNVPEIVTEVFDSELEFSDEENRYIEKLKESGTTNDLDELFKFLFIKTCNSMHEYLPELFESNGDYSELLYDVSFVDTEGVVCKLLEIEADNFDVESENGNGQVEVIGWLYQYYNIEPKAKVFSRPKSQKIRKEEVPAATQLFTPDWIVRYMVENSLGRLWYEGNEDDDLKSKWKYYLEEAKQEERTEEELNQIRNEYKNIKPEDIKLIDPCMGSGHILVYAFEVLIDIYKSQGFSEREAARSILENNIYGLDIDKRAYQLSYFALMMKARKYDRQALKRKIKLRVLSINESNILDRNILRYFGNNLPGSDRDTAIVEINYILDLFKDAKEYGSLLEVNKCDWSLLEGFVDDYCIQGQITFETVNLDEYAKELKQSVKQAQILSEKYDVVVTNPPYMGGSGMSAKLSSYAKKEFKDSKSDLFAMFIERCQRMTAINKYTAMITMHSWMFLSSFEKLRAKILQSDIINMVHLGARAFEEIGGEVVQTTTFIVKKSDVNEYLSTYFRLVNYNSQVEKENAFEAKSDLFKISKNEFHKIPGSPIAYWASKKVLGSFGKGIKMMDIAVPKQGLATTDNDRFLRAWHEVSYNSIGFGKSKKEAIDSQKKWFPLNKGGGFRKWFGNNTFVVNYYNDGEELIETVRKKYTRISDPEFVIKNRKYYFLENGTWSAISSGNISVRYSPKGFIISNAGMAIYNNDYLYYIIAFMNSVVVSEILIKIINQTLNFNAGDIEKIPIIISEQKIEEVNNIVNENILLSTKDWDMQEASWNFKRNSLICEDSISKAYMLCKREVEERFVKLKENEKELNNIFIEIYNFEDIISSEVVDKDITVSRIYDNKFKIPEYMGNTNYISTKQDLVKQFISYIVGCIFGRYSLDMDGLIYAGGQFNESLYTTFEVDVDNCVPITDNKYFEDDIVSRFVEFLTVVYGKESLEENLEFISDALGSKGDSRECIRKYFLKDFFKDHCKMYKKRPIYWLYDSGKQNGFKALVYLHRYNEQTTGIVRAKYLHELQKHYSATINTLNSELDSNTSAHSRKVAEDRIKKIQRQLDECKVYDEKLGHIANEKIAIDLDDGVKVNYEKVQTDRNGKLLQILAKIK